MRVEGLCLGANCKDERARLKHDGEYKKNDNALKSFKSRLKRYRPSGEVVIARHYWRILASIPCAAIVDVHYLYVNLIVTF